MTRILFLAFIFAFGAAEYCGREILDETSPFSVNSGIIDPNKRWPNKTIPYLIVSGFTYSDIFRKAIKHIQGRTCIRLVSKYRRDHVNIIQDGTNCYSYIGKQGFQQNLSLGTGCGRLFDTHVHELVHAIGFFHEHKRTDRDQFVTINEENIDLAKRRRFGIGKYNSTFISPFGVPYDYSSVMQFERTHNSVDAIKETTTPMDPTAVIGEANGLSDFDVKKINNMYCNGTMGIRIQNVANRMYLTVDIFRKFYRKVITSDWTGSESQNWTVDWYAARRSSEGSSLVPWSQEEFFTAQVMIEYRYGAIIEKDLPVPEKWVFMRTSYGLDSVWQIKNNRTGRCVKSLGTSQADSAVCNKTDLLQLWNVYTAKTSIT